MVPTDPNVIFAWAGTTILDLNLRGTDFDHYLSLSSADSNGKRE
jgi:hypothetical protein